MFSVGNVKWPLKNRSDNQFAFEEERLAAGLPINRTREFMTELRKRLAESEIKK